YKFGPRFMFTSKLAYLCSGAAGHAANATIVTGLPVISVQDWRWASTNRHIVRFGIKRRTKNCKARSHPALPNYTGGTIWDRCEGFVIRTRVRDVLPVGDRDPVDLDRLK